MGKLNAVMLRRVDPLRVFCPIGGVFTFVKRVRANAISLGLQFRVQTRIAPQVHRVRSSWPSPHLKMDYL